MRRHACSFYERGRRCNSPTIPFGASMTKPTSKTPTTVGREFIGRVFAICVFGGLGSLPGTIVAAVSLGLVENLSTIFIGASWSPAVAFGVLLATLAWRPSGLFGRS
jgi:branched-subunit amino acid ABC-type transport system permease component